MPFISSFFALRDRLTQLKSDLRGVAAVEFALILPFLLVLLIGMAETVGALNHDRKVSQVASSVADLVAQASSLNSADVTDIMVAAKEIMKPYSATSLDVIIASVTFDENGDPKVDWSRDKSGGTPWPTDSEPPVTFPAALSIPGTSLVVAQSSYHHVPMFATLAQNIFPRATSIELGDTYYFKPRLSAKVTLEP